MSQPCLYGYCYVDDFPVWADPEHYNRLPAGSIDNLDKWGLVHKMLELAASHLTVNILIVNLEGICVCGSGHYCNGIGFKVPQDGTLTHTMRTRQSTLMLNPGTHSVCQECSRKLDCDDVANFSGPIIIDGEMIAVIHIVAFSTDQRAELLAYWNSLFDLLTNLVRFVFMSSERQLLDMPRQNQSAQEFPDLVGHSPAMQRLRADIDKTAASGFPILIQGESGTGKELVARSIHERSRCAKGPFVAVNCGAIPETLMESVLFGYEPGAFSGATARGKPGLFEEADKGTFFLDEVSEMPLNMQVKLLRVLQEKRVLRIGGKQTKEVDFRLIAATNRNIRDMVKRGEFREDLFFRLDVLPLTLPPLREKTEDIPFLTLHYLEKFNKESGKSFRVTTELLQYMERYHWPGNVRELINMLWYGVTFSTSGILTLDSLADRFHAAQENSVTSSPAAPVEAAVPPQPRRAPPSRSVRRRRELQEKRLLFADAVRRHEDTTEGKRMAAKELGVSLATLYRVLREEEN